MTSAFRIGLGAFALAAAAIACDAITDVAVKGVDFGGATADAHCDRRFVTEGGVPSAFCQEALGTLAASQFADDCRSKHQATAGTGACPKERVIAGCRLLEKHDDNSTVNDWYYDVSDLEKDAGPDVDAGGIVFDPPVPESVSQVAATCADTTRYDHGAQLVTK